MKGPRSLEARRMKSPSRTYGCDGGRGQLINIANKAFHFDDYHVELVSGTNNMY